MPYISMIPNILVTIFVMSIGVLIGHKVQQKCLFTYPTDIVTISIFTFYILQLLVFPALETLEIASLPILDIPLLEGYLAFGIGYLMGYVLARGDNILHIRTWANGEWRKTWIVRYQLPDSNRTYMAEQSNLSLLKRIFCGIHHEILTNDHTVFTGRDQPSTSRYPWWPVHKSKDIWVLDWDIEERTEKRRFLSYKIRTSHVKLSWGSQAEIHEVLRAVDTLHKLNDTIARQERQLGQYRDRMASMVADQVGVIMSATHIGDPINHYLDTVKREEERKAKEEEDKSKRSENESKANVP